MQDADQSHNSNSDRNLTLKVYDRIKGMIINYDIVPGQRLIFIDLARQLGVSRTPVNNALGMLAKEGFLDFVPHQGYTVHRITREEAESLYEIMRIILLGVVDRAIGNLTPEGLEIWLNKKRDYEEAVTQLVSRGRFILDQEFHAYMVELSNILYLADYFREVYQRVFLRHRIEGLAPERAQEVVVEHNAIFEAVRLKDAERAKELLSSHIDEGKRYICSHIFWSVESQRGNPHEKR